MVHHAMSVMTLVCLKKYNKTKDKNIIPGDHYTTKATCIEEVKLKFTSGKTLIMKEVLHCYKTRFTCCLQFGNT